MGHVNTIPRTINKVPGQRGQTMVSQGPDETEVWSSPGGGCAHMYMVTPIATALASANTFYKMNGLTAAYLCNGYTHSNNRLTYIGAEARRFLVNAVFSISSDKKDLDVLFELYINGSTGEVLASRIKRTLRAVGDMYLMALASLINLSPNDYVELWGSASVDNANVTVHTLGFIIQAFCYISLP